ncbi:MAG: thermostable hemolysin [Porticoccaceae bacterium]
MTKSITRSAENFRARPELAGCQFHLYSPNSSDRERVTAYIAEKYKQVHKAHLHEFLPILIQITRDQSPLAAFGLQPGQYCPLFLEQYLNQPVEQYVSKIAGGPIDRYSLMEIGNLVITNPVYGPLLLVVLASSLAKANYKWMVFTATKQVERLVRGMGFDPHYLVSADPSRLVDEQANWGTYYNNNPGVMVGNTGKAVELISENPFLKNLADQHRETINQVSLAISNYRRISKG